MKAQTKQLRLGFTLIELLVVVAIIALLISILLPSLNGARRVAKRVVCSSNQRQIGIGMRSYAEESEDWAPGAPNGSGVAAYSNVNVLQYRQAATTVWDWANPIRKYVIKDSNVDPDMITRMAQAREGVFACPEVQEKMYAFRGVPVGHPYFWQKAPSYLTMWKMMLVGDSFRESPGGQGRVQGSFFAIETGAAINPPVRWQVYVSSWETSPPSDYQPKTAKVGNNGRKIYTMDGARYVTDNGDYDYDAQRTDWGAGSFSASGPVYNLSREYSLPRSIPLSYRHGSGRSNGAVALFWDGHADFLSQKQTRDVRLTSPTGSKINDIGQLHNDSRDLNWTNNQIIPD